MAALIIFLSLVYGDPLSPPHSNSIIKYLNNLILVYPTITIFLSVFLILAGGVLLYKIYTKWDLNNDVTTLVKSKHFQEKEFESLIS